MRRWIAGVIVVLVAAPAGYGHPTGRPHGGYRATFSNVDPPILGLQVAVLSGDKRLRIANISGKRVVILDAEGQAFLRFTRGAVYRYEASAGGWEQVTTGTTYDWVEPRISWNKTSPPAVVAADPTEAHLIREWAVPGRANGVAFEIRGFLGWGPHASSASAQLADSGNGRAFFIAFGLTAVVIAAAVAFYLLRMRTSSSSRSA